ncbi:MAG: carboxypeptidase regulatory-like domain-containing protein [Cyclobacteriaceae bacterium]|nr:carboxypeptidase regulatory-like domain-containing protein [Cyclobacteriaceae bacterium]
MEKVLIFLLSILFLLGCINQKHNSGKQGIIGEVRWIEGNLMPAIGDTTYIERAKGIPIERDIYIFKAVKQQDALSAGGTFYKSINGELVYRLKSRKDGTFKVKLPPGRYSIFVMEKDGYFANIFDGDNYINPVTVQANKFTAIQIQVNYKAFY